MLMLHCAGRHYSIFEGRCAPVVRGGKVLGVPPHRHDPCALVLRVYATASRCCLV